MSKDFFDVSMNYETSEKEDFFSRISTNLSLPTVFSPTPSSQTMFSPSSVDEDAIGKGYLEQFEINPLTTCDNKPKLGSSIKFNNTNKNITKLVPSASGESFGTNLISPNYLNVTTNRPQSSNRLGRYETAFFDDDADADTCSIITTMHYPYQINSARPTIGQLTNGYHLAPATASSNLPFTIKQAVDFNLTKPDQQLTSTIKFGKNSFSYIDQNDDDECNDDQFYFIQWLFLFCECLLRNFIFIIYTSLFFCSSSTEISLIIMVFRSLFRNPSLYLNPKSIKID